ncbi:glycosyltransferase [Desulfocurvus sp. DL9XJH121]
MSRTYIFMPPLAKATGGTHVLHQVAAHLHAAGREVALVVREGGHEGPVLSRDVPVVPWDEMRLTPDDIWLVPEGWVNALAPGLKAEARTLVYVQNWAYVFSALPQGVAWDQLDVSFVAVSEPVAWYLRLALGEDAPVLRPGIDLDLFFPAPEPPPASPVRVAYMPRKNKALAAQVRAVLEARAPRSPSDARVQWVEIHGLDQAGVARALAGSHLFLAMGYPEGCPLPPLEAMACGCPVVGFAGLGGFDYMRQAHGEMGDVAGAARPWCPLRETPWGGNGLYAADADVAAAALALERAVAWAAQGAPQYAAMRQAALETARAYGLDEQRKAVLELWDRF